MSSEAVAAVRADAKAHTPSEFIVLLALAERADERGVVRDMRIDDVVDRTPLKRRGVQGACRRMEADGRLEVIEPGGGRGNPRVWRIATKDLDQLEKAHVEDERAHAAALERAHENDEGASVRPLDGLEQPPSPPVPPPSPTRASTPATARARGNGEREAFAAELLAATGQLDGAPPLNAAEEADAVALLAQGRKVAGRKVTGREMAIAAVAVATFNDGTGSDYGLGAHLTPIVGRVRDRPNWSSADHVRLVQSACRLRWWERNGKGKRATPAVIYSEKSFDRCVQDAADEAAERKRGSTAPPGKRFTRRREG